MPVSHRKFFGTDGVRGRANSYPVTAEIALKIGLAAGKYFKNGDKRHRVIIGKDPRRSSYMLENALASGFVSMGMDVFTTGPLPTPAIGMLVRSLRADVGVMISASHNPHHDNGVKLFGPDGYKLSDAAELAIEADMVADLSADLAAPEDLGRLERLEGAAARYIEFTKSSLPRTTRFDGLKVVVDCANGAAYHTAPEIFRELGADVISMGDDPDGFNINVNCGSTAPQACRRRVLESGADLGIALDGDADRVHLIDETGHVVDGDQVMALIATSWARDGRLRGGSLVATVMSNMGLERRLAKDGVGLLRTKVGDRYVVEKMRETGCNLGGEQSGHIVMSDMSTTGDGALAAVQAASEILRQNRPASEVCSLFKPLPQMLKNVRYDKEAQPLDAPSVKRAIADAEAKLSGTGRVLIRKSGTEPLIRVMGEGEDAALVDLLTDNIRAEIAAVAAPLTDAAE